MTEPIQEFESIEQAYECLKEWQERLFLNDWIIKINLVEPNEMPDYMGYNDFCVESCHSVINLAKLTDDTKNRILKVPQEWTLVHELLHLKFNFFVDNLNTCESLYLSKYEHRILDQMSKSLIMAKYNLNYDWFRNF